MTRRGQRFDQQPIEVAALADACARAFDITGESEWRDIVGSAWAWFEAQPPSYRHLATFWVVSAKRPATRSKRLATLVEYSAEGRKVPPLAS